MTPIQFAFEQNQLASYFVNENFDKLVISLCNLTMPGETEPYLYACGQAYTASNTIVQGTSVFLACPNPPGWKDCDGEGNVSLVTHAQLNGAPKFSLSKVQLGAILVSNKYKKGSKSQVLVQLEGENTKDGLETFIKLVSLDEEGKNLDTAKAGSFTDSGAADAKQLNVA